MGDKLEIMRAENPECSGGQLGHKWGKCEISESMGGGRQLGDKCAIMRIKALRASRLSLKETKPKTNAKSCGRACTLFKGVRTSATPVWEIINRFDREDAYGRSYWQPFVTFIGDAFRVWLLWAPFMKSLELGLCLYHFGATRIV